MIYKMCDILKPDLIWIEGRCYRINDPTTEVTSLQEHDLYENETMITDLDVDEDDDNVEIVMMDNSRFCTTLHVSKHYIGYVIGKKGAVKYRIERDTRTEIKIPKMSQTGDIVIMGPSESNVKAARRRINIIVMSSRMKQKSTHFISIPMNHPNIIESFEKFKTRVLTECPNPTFDETLFIRPNKLHITMGVMCLMDNEERLLASKLLTEAKQNIIIPILNRHAPLRIRLKGLAYMNDDPRQIDVLYGKVQEEGSSTGVLQNLGDSLVEHFYKAGFMDRDHGRENIKLHVTLINSKYRHGSSTTENSGSNGRKPRQCFDGSEILSKFSEYDFGVMELTELHLSQRHSMGDDGYYQPTYVINLN